MFQIVFFSLIHEGSTWPLQWMRVLWKEMILNCQTKNGNQKWCVSSVSPDWLIMTCHTNLGNIVITASCHLNHGAYFRTLGLRVSRSKGQQGMKKIYWPNFTLALIHLRILRLVRAWAMLRENSTTRWSVLDGSISSRLFTTGSIHLKLKANKISMAEGVHSISSKTCLWVDFLRLIVFVLHTQVHWDKYAPTPTPHPPLLDSLRMSYHAFSIYLFLFKWNLHKCHKHSISESMRESKCTDRSISSCILFTVSVYRRVALSFTVLINSPWNRTHPFSM